MTDQKTSHISVIIPTLNEESNLAIQLSALQAYPDLEIIVADGNSEDQTAAIAQKHRVMLIWTEGGRSRQLNCGAEAASGNILLFLHCDTLLPDNFGHQIHDILNLPGTSAGAFQLNIKARGIGYRLVEWGVNLRSRLCRLPYGDQAIFIRKDIFDQVGGFPDFPIMEDLGLVRRLKRLGTIRIAPAAVITSARRWQELGIIRTTLLNQVMLIGFFLNADLKKLRQRYYRNTSRSENASRGQS